MPTYAFERQRYWIDAAVEEPSVAQQLLTQSDKSSLEEAFYVPSWSASGQLSVALDTAERAAGSCWLIFADTDGIGDALAASSRPALASMRYWCDEVLPFSSDDGGTFFIRASGGRSDYMTLLKELKRQSQYSEPDRAPVGGGVGRSRRRIDCSSAWRPVSTACFIWRKRSVID